MYFGTLVLYKKSVFSRPTLKCFKKRHYILVLRGSARQKRAFFWSKFSKKKPCFFFKLCPQRKKLCPNTVFIVFWERWETHFFNRPSRKNTKWQLEVQTSRIIFFEILYQNIKVMLSVYDLHQKTRTQFWSFPMHCKCETIKFFVTPVLSEPWFLSHVFGHKNILKTVRNSMSKIHFFNLWENATHTAPYMKNH